MAGSHFSGVAIGSEGSELSLVKKGTVSVNPASIAAGAESDVSVTIAGAAVGDIIIVNPPALTAGIAVSYARVSAANTVIIRLRNASGGAIDEAAASWAYCIIRS